MLIARTGAMRAAMRVNFMMNVLLELVQREELGLEECSGMSGRSAEQELQQLFIDNPSPAEVQLRSTKPQPLNIIPSRPIFNSNDLVCLSSSQESVASFSQPCMLFSNSATVSQDLNATDSTVKGASAVTSTI
jgi:hypothetical protein